MNRFNLSFKGNILPGHDLARVQTRLANALGLPGPDSTAPFFSGKAVTLRRNLDRKVAADWYRKLRDIGMDVELVKVTDAITSETHADSAVAPTQQDTETAATASQKTEPTARDTDTTDTAHATHRGMDQEIHQSKPGQIDQSWAVPSSRATSNDRLQKSARAQVSDEQRRAQAAAAARLADEQAAEAARRKQLEEDARRKAQQKLEQERKQQEEREQQAAELAAQREAKARRDAEEQKKAKEAAERKAKDAAELKARQQAEAAREAVLQAQREAKAKAERDKLAQQEAQRQREEQRKAEQLAAAEAARARAAALEEKRKAAARDALKKAQEEERKREAAQALAHKKAQEKKRKAEEAARAKAAREAEKARQKAEREEAKRNAHAAAEQARAEQKQARLKAREEAQRAKAEKAEIARIAAQDAAREKARQEAQRMQREAELAEKRAREQEARLLAAAEAARQKAEAEHRRAEAAAKLQAQQEEARLAQKLAQAEAEQARKAAIAVQKQEQAKERQRKAEEKQRKAREKAKRKAAEQAEREQQQALALAERAKLEDQVIATGAAKLKDSSTGISSKPRVKTRLEVPTRPSHKDAIKRTGQHSSEPTESTASTSDTSTPLPAYRHQTGAPNLYTLAAFHNSQELRQRPAESAAKAKRGMLAVVGAMILLVISIAVFTLREPATVQQGPIAITSSSEGELAVLGVNTLYLHDRSGLGTQTLTHAELGLELLQPPLYFGTDGSLYGLGVLRGSTRQTRLIRCVLADKQCMQVFDRPDNQTATAITSFAINELNGDRYILSDSPAALQRYNTEGELLAKASLSIAELPTMQLDSGLIFINSEFDSAISVFRPDIANFGQQLDEVLLMPPSAIANQHSVVLDFLPINQQWWVVLGDPQSQSSALYRFDASWRFLSEFPLPAAYYPARLSGWNHKVLVSHPSQIKQIRLSKEGLEEAHYQSNLLVDAVSASENAIARQRLLQRVLPALLLALTLIAVAYTSTHRLRSRVYLHSKAQGAESLEDAADTIRWIDPDPRRTARYRQLAILLAIGYAGVLVTSIGLTLPPGILAAILLVLSGPVITLYLLYRAPVGHIGSRDDTLVLVDHNDLYHMGAGPRIQYRSRFVLIDDVAVFMGASLLPTFEPDQLKTLEATITAGVKVESKAVWVRLLQARHPLAIGSLVCTVGIVLAGIVLVV